MNYTYARCAGTTHPNCLQCGRREPWYDEWESHTLPPIDMDTGECDIRIAPSRTVIARKEAAL